MDMDGFNLIVPVMATTSLSLEGGHTIQQSVPEDYFIAANCISAMQKLNGRDLEFIMKAYLPINIIVSKDVNRFGFIENLGLVSSRINPLDDRRLDEILDLVDETSSEEEILKAIKFFSDSLDALEEKREVTVSGLISEEHDISPCELLEWPTIDRIEPYSFILTPAKKLPDPKEVEILVCSTLDYVHRAEDIFHKSRRTLTNRIQELIDSLELEVKTQVERLDRRISHLENEIANLEFLVSKDKTTQKTLEARRKALKRDIDRRSKLISEVQHLRETIDEQTSALDTKLEHANKSIRNIRNNVDTYSSQIGSYDISSGNNLLLIPFLLIGMTKKGKLEMMVVPPSFLASGVDKVGRRRDYVNPFQDSSNSISRMRERISDLLSSDVTIRKEIRNKSETLNLLTLTVGRNIILEGAKGLVADGYVKQDLLDQLAEILAALHEKALPDIVKVLGPDEIFCKIKFHITDENGQPVDEVVIEIDSQRLKSSKSGLVRATLPIGKHSGIIKAFGFSDAIIEFTLDSIQDAVIPITMQPLPPEVRLELTLDRLMKRADRIDSVRSKLWDAFQSHGDTLLGIPAYRGTLKELLVELGYEPENWISQAKTRKGMVKRLLKRDDRTDGIRRDILKIAEKSKQFGGIMLISDLLVELDKQGWDTVPDEVDDVLDDMKRDGLIEGISTSSSGTRIVQFIPVALTDDPNLILEIAADFDGVLTIEEVVLKLGWNEERVMNTFDLLVSRGVAKLQKSYSGGTKYWFPGLRGGKK